MNFPEPSAPPPILGDRRLEGEVHVPGEGDPRSLRNPPSIVP